MRTARRKSVLRRTAELVLLLGACAGLMPPLNAAAQLYSILHRPAPAEYYRFQTPHLRLIYQKGLFEEARETADVLERVYPEIDAAVGLRRSLDVPVILKHYTDQGNGFVSSWPFRQELDAVPLRGKALSQRFPSWFELVGLHELAHAAHAESGHGFGLGWILRRIGPDLARSLNLSGPRGINEGLAVWLESRLYPGAGRLNHSLFEMEMRAAILSNDPWSLAQMLEPPAYTRPFDRYYNGGAHVFEYLAGTEGIEFFHRTRNFFYRFPLLGYAPALWYGTGMMPHVVGRRIRQHYKEEVSAFQADRGPFTKADKIVSIDGASFRRPSWIDDRTLIAHAAGYALRPGFYRIDAETGDRDVIAHEAITEDMQFSLSADRQSILFSRYVTDVLAPVRRTAEIFRLDVASGDVTRLTSGARAFGPVPGEEGAVWVLVNGTQFNEWRALDGADARLVGTLERTSIVAIHPSPNGERIAILANHGGRQGIFEAELEDGQLVQVRPLLVPEEASVFDVAWSPDGRHIVFSADPDGVSNIFALAMNSGRIMRLTSAEFGAIEPGVSPDGEWLAYVNYRHERFELVRIPFRPEGAVPQPFRLADDRPAAAAADVSSEGVSDQGGQGSAPFSPEKYNALTQMRPRVAYPFVVYEPPAKKDGDLSLGLGGGAGLEWADPMQVWAAHTRAYYQHGTLWGRAAVQSGRWILRPSADVYRSPSAVTVLRRQEGRVDTARVGRDERGVGVGVQTPVVLQSSVYQSQAHLSLRAEYRQERLFGLDNETLREADGRVAVNPAVQFIYGYQRNVRDLVPNSGLAVTAVSKVDVWAERGRPTRWVRADGRFYVPLLHRTNTGVQLNGRLLAQNRGGIVAVGTFVPRGYETDDLFLGEGLFVSYGMEITQPLWYVDDGLMLIPVYVKAIFIYGFAESMQKMGADGETLSVAGAGLGVELRLAHSFDVTLRIAPVYRFASEEWEWTLR